MYLSCAVFIKEERKEGREEGKKEGGEDGRKEGGKREEMKEITAMSTLTATPG